ncbi:uncharacterized protein N7518_005719 [Penicillium psychrosexuale]|uniref:uncharacterized protein n=1 Tax=Penicillium psychrosexuale TaxID=1002107 RepID=UPI002545BB87|nr:uncharacterized protein N7518_005719 [Penicillium psychrosexuale]KAJ5797179.1 hypothetical protein N7518_005719 [Penicillium psychrosexuale]
MGIALNMIIAANTTLLRLVENWTTLETSLGAVSRLRSVDHGTLSEDEGWDCLEPSPEWPIHRSQYFVGGKSSLFLTLLQLLRLQAGTIEVDGVDITRLPVHVVRRRCFVTVPQDPFMLPDASLRFNLDPYNQHQDVTILEILHKTGLWSKESTLDRQSCTTNAIIPGTVNTDFLDQPLASFPPVSTGQRQIFAFTQALLRVTPSTLEWDPVIDQRKPIILLDEASSSLDLETEIKMQEMVKEYLVNQGHTTIAIAHRINAVRKDLRPTLDTIVWMEDGRPRNFQRSNEVIVDIDIDGDR